MATQVQKCEYIESGPSNWDLVIEGLAQRKPMVFTLRNLGRVKVAVRSLRREPGDGQLWFITGWIMARKANALAERGPFSALYDTHDRHGWYIDDLAELRPVALFGDDDQVSIL